MTRDDLPPKVKIRKKEAEAQKTGPEAFSILSQMERAILASLRGALRGLREKDTAALAQAAKNGRIVEELYFQTEKAQENSPERRILDLARELSRLAEDGSKARQGANQEMDSILDQLTPYLESILQDLTPSKTRRFMPGEAPPSRRKLQELKDRTIEAVTRSSDQDSVLSGISLYRMIETIQQVSPLAVRIGADLTEGQKR